jgi:hypothetical protein
MNEHVFHFGNSGKLVGILTEQSETEYNQDRPALIFLNSGLIHRIGPNRLTVRIARSLADLGFCSFRFDFSGIGDSPVSTDAKSLQERWVAETKAAMDLVSAKRRAAKFILVGNCSGAAFSFLTSRTDSRVIGAILINLQGPRKLIRYYVKLAFSSAKIWLRVLNASAQYQDFFKNLSTLLRKDTSENPKMTYSENDFFADLKSMLDRGMKLIFVYSEWDPGLPYFQVHVAKRLKKIALDRNLDMQMIPGINHDFNLLSGQDALIKIVQRWIAQNFAVKASL